MMEKVPSTGLNTRMPDIRDTLKSLSDGDRKIAEAAGVIVHVHLPPAHRSIVGRVCEFFRRLIARRSS